MQTPATEASNEGIFPVPTLVFDDASLADRQIPLTESVATLGRGLDNQYVLDDPRVSRLHAEIRREAGSILVTDLGSAAGTFVDGERLTGPAIVHHGQRIAFGPVTGHLVDPVADEDGTSTLVIHVPEISRGPRLSPRQQQVLEGMAEGMTNSRIAEELGITERTVKAYAQELFEKLDARNRAGAVAEGVRQGLL